MERHVKQIGAAGAAAGSVAAAPDAAALLHELETQNHELRRTQRELATARDRWRDLYDRAPVAYLTLDSRGRIEDANQTAARLLGCPQRSLAQRPLSAFMSEAEAKLWQRRVADAFREIAPWHTEVHLRRPDGQVLEAQLDAVLVARAGEPPSLRVTLTDVALHRHAAADRRAARQVVAEQEADRHRVARELHDDLGQRLSALKMNLSARAPAAVAGAELAAMLETLDNAVASVRRMAGDLRPLMLDDLGLAAAVEALARRAARKHGLRLRLQLTAADPAPGDAAAVTLYRLLQAGLSLMAAEPGVAGLRITLRDEPGARLLTLQGQGGPSTPAAAAAPDARRWTALRETAQVLGCTLETDSARRGGMRVTVRMPLSTAEATNAA